MSEEENTPERTLVRLICDYTHMLRGEMVIKPRCAIKYAEELVRRGRLTSEEVQIVERYKKASQEFDRVNTDMFFLGKKYGGDDL